MPSVSASPTRLKFWGTRGSISVPGGGSLRYGGNTTCIEVRADGEIIVLDAGSGIRSLGIALLPDHEPYQFLHSARASDMSPDEAKKTAGKERIGLVDFLHGSDILILDAQYTDAEYESHVGWGHGSVSSAVSLALDSKVRRLLLFHHDPSHDDTTLDAIVDDARRLIRERGQDLDVDGAREGEEVRLK